MAYDIPLFDLNYGSEEEVAVLDVLRTRWISMGPRVQELESWFERHLGVTHAVAVTNCTAALHLALAVLDVGPGDEVIVPSLTFVATVSAVRYVGATPVFADLVDLEDLTLDPRDVAAMVTPKTRAIIVMHYGGFATDMEAVLAVARRHGLAVVEDAAHAPSSTWRGRMLGTLGDVGCLSFYANKNITCAEGGMLVTARDDLARRAALLRAHGMTSLSFDRAQGHATAYDVLELGYNYRLDDVRASLMIAQAHKLADDIARRRSLRQAFEERLVDIDGIHVPFHGRGDESSNYILPIILREGGYARRDAVRERLAAGGIQTSVHYPAVHRFSFIGAERRTLPVTEHAADHEITLPMYPALTETQVDAICCALKESL